MAKITGIYMRLHILDENGKWVEIDEPARVEIDQPDIVRIPGTDIRIAGPDFRRAQRREGVREYLRWFASWAFGRN